MKLSNIILNEQNEFKSQIEALERELNQEYRPYVSMGAYHQPRPDSDPLKNKGFGSVTFLHKDELPENEFSKAIASVSSKGYEVDEEQSTNYYENEPGERDYFPKIKFTFNLDVPKV
mgnify:FL=1|tara:strand:- start:2354 stop:2704 length:351 start_codon:yes stop_codon:yes gene_type:complete